MHTKKLFDLSEQVAIVTGGAGLYGRSIARALAEAGATTIIASRNISQCDQVAHTLNKEQLRAVTCQLDLGNQESIDDLVKWTIAEFGRIDILVNNSVSRDGMADLEDLTGEGWALAQRINSTGLMLITQAVIRHMKDQGRGNIINIGSIQGVNGPRFPVYEGTEMSSPLNYTYDKWGMIGFTKWIANKYGPHNIRCNCLSPGGYGPGVKEIVGENEFYHNYVRLTPLRRFADDEDLKGPIVFLASAASSYVTGQNLLVDGGWTSW